MRSTRGRDTTPELEIRRRLHSRGFRYRVSARPVAGLRRTADVVFTRAKVAIFIDGCFWHGCPQHYQTPVRNAGFWSAKMNRNRERDAETDRVLVESGWRVLRVWEHEVRADPEAVVEAIGVAVRA